MERRETFRSSEGREREREREIKKRPHNLHMETPTHLVLRTHWHIPKFFDRVFDKKFLFVFFFPMQF